MADYETLHVCPVPYCQQCVKFWWRSSDPIKFNKCNCVCVSGDMSPYCSTPDEWLIMKLCIYVRYHTANNVSNVGGDPVTQLHFITIFNVFSYQRHFKRLSTLSASWAFPQYHQYSLNCDVSSIFIKFIKL